MNECREALKVYLVTDRTWLNGNTLEHHVEKALKGGITFLQLREKGLPYEDFLHQARSLKQLAEKYEVPFVINDNVDIAVAVDADGVHVGQMDHEAGTVRARIGKNKILGVSVFNREQAVLAQQQGADYLGVGAVFNTSTKNDAELVPLEILKEICGAVTIPVVAIGGISEENLLELKGTGIDGVAVISAILGKKDITAAAKQIASLMEGLK